MDAQRSALVVASYEFQDPKLRRLRAPARDAEELARVLSNADIGDFKVEVSVNEPEHVVRRKLAAFFQNRGLDDLLLLHLSCHGLKDDDGRLYFATADTEVAHLDATAIPSEFVNRQMTRSRSRRIVLLLDCCYSGAFASGMLSRAGDRVDIKERFDGRGRVVLTASSAMEYSFEGDELSGAPNPSFFTSALVKGLESGEADRDRNGWISVEELYDYAYDEVRALTPSQTPGKWTFEVQGELYLARSSLAAVPEPVELPAELQSAMASPFAHVRLGAVQELISLARGADKALADAARSALEQLVEDDSRRVSEAATQGLSDRPVIAPPEPAPPEPVVVAEPERPPPALKREPVAPLGDRTDVWVPALAFVGAAALFLAYVLSIDGFGSILRTAWLTDGDQWLLLSPLEWVGGWVGALMVTLGLVRGRIGAALAAGLLLGLGILGVASGLALIAYHGLHGGAGALMVGAIALIVAALLAMRVRAREALVRPSPQLILLAPAGAALMLWALSLDWKPDTSLLGYDELGLGHAYVLEVLVALAVVAGAAGLLLWEKASSLAAGVLVAAGALALLHFVGVVIAGGLVEGVDDMQAGGLVGAFGGALVIAAGIAGLPRAAISLRPELRPAEHSLPAVPPVAVSVVAALGVVGAAALFATLWLDVDPPKSLAEYAATFEDRDAPLLYPKLEFTLVSLSVAAICLALVLGRIRRSLAGGLLVGFGVLSAAAAVNLRDFFELLSYHVVPLGALAILPAGVACAWGARDSNRASGIDWVALVLGAAGAVLCLLMILPLSRTYGSANVAYAAEFHVAAVAIAISVLVLALFSRTVFVAGVMVSLGAQTTLHAIELIRVQWVDDLRLAAILGMLGGALTLAAGLWLLRPEPARSPRPSPA